jgi:hypothetical protein
MSSRFSRGRRLLTGLLVATGALFALGGTAMAEVTSFTGPALGKQPLASTGFGNFTVTYTNTTAGLSGNGDSFRIYFNPNYDDFSQNNLVVPAGVTCTPSYAYIDCVLTADIAAAATKVVTYKVDAPTYASTYTPYVYDNDASVDTYITGWNHQGSEYSFENGGPSSIDIDVVGDRPHAVVKGSSVSFQVRVSNLGTGPALNLTLADDWAANQSASVAGLSCANSNSTSQWDCNIGTLAAGESRTYAVTVTGNEFDDVAPGYDNGYFSFYVQSKEDAHSDSNSYFSLDLPVTDGTFSKLTNYEVDTPEVVRAGQSVTYQFKTRNTGNAAYPASKLRLRNNGDTPLSAASFGGVACAVDPAASPTDHTPYWLCDVPAIAPGAELAESLTFQVDADNYDPYIYTYSQFIDWADPTAVGALHQLFEGDDPSVRAYTPNTDPLAPDLVLTGSAPTTTTVGSDTTFTFNIANAGHRTSFDAYVEGTFPAGVTWVSGTNCFVQPGRNFWCDAGDIVEGGSKTVTVTLHSPSLGAVGFQAWAYGDGSELSYRNNDVSLNSIVVPVAPVTGGGPSPLAALGAAVKQTIAQAVASGVPVTVTPNADGSVLIQLYLAPGTAKGLHLKAKPVLVGSSKTAVKGGKKVTIKTKFTKKAKGKIAASKKAVSVSEVITFTNSAGKKVVKRRTVVLKKK